MLIKGKLEDAGAGYLQHAVELAFPATLPPPAPNEPATVVPFATRALADDEGAFVLEVPAGTEPDGPVRITVYDAGGAVLLAFDRAGLPPATELLRLTVTPGEPFVLDEHPDPFVDAPARFSGRLADRRGRRPAGWQVVLFGTRRLPGGPDPIESVLGVAESAASGYFSMPYPRVFLVTARLEAASDGRRASSHVALDADGRLAAEARMVVDVGDDAGTEGTVPRAPEPEDRAGAPEVFTTDLGGGRCVRLNSPNRTLEEYQYFTIVRTTDPFILGPRPRPPARPPKAVLDLASKLALGYDTLDDGLQPKREGERSAERPESPAYDRSGLAVAGKWRAYLDRDSVSKALTPDSLRLAPEVLSSVLRDPDGFTPVSLMAAERLSAFRYLEDLVEAKHAPAAGRGELSVENPVPWETLPRSSQAATIAHGHILQFRQIWKADGYSLGDLVYSLPLAPCQKKEIVIVDWDRRESAVRSESRRFEERLDARLAHDRGISEIVKSVLTESVRGGSSSNVWAAGGGFGLGIPIGAGFLGIGAGGGAGGASSEAWQHASRSLAGSSLQQLRERITQSAAALRSQRVSVVQSVRQGETHQVQAEVVANHNHCHAITVEYFEVLQHFQVHHKLVGVRECLFVPLIMTPFTDDKVIRWRDQIEPRLLRRDLVGGFDAIERIQSGYAGTGYPAATYGDELMRSVDGEIIVRVSVARPRDPEEAESLDDYFGEVWRFFPRQLAESLYNSYVKNQAEQDRRFQADVGPRIARNFVDSIKARFRMRDGTTRDAHLDVTLVADYREGKLHLVRLRSTNATPQLRRSDVTGIVLSTTFQLPAGSRVVVEQASLHYRADTHSEQLYRVGRLFDDLGHDDTVFLNTSRSTELERKNPKKEDLGKRRQLLKHLDESLEHYHRIIWWNMDASRRFMLLDGFEAPFTGGRSVASVVENRIVAIVGNCLVMPVAAGYRLDPRYRDVVDGGVEGEPPPPPTLLDLYTPLTPPKPLVLSLPTKGVYAEAIMGDCNSCETIDETRFWRWEQEPCPDEPTAIAPVSTESLRTPAPVLTPKDLPAPIVNIQSAPTAPAPVGIGAALGVLANADAFRDITGLTQNQLNALSALQSSLKVAESFGKQAAGFVKSQEARRALPRSLEAIKSARDKKLITDEDARELTEQAFQTALGIPPGTSKPVQKQAVKDVVDSAIQSAKSKTTITDQVGDRKQTVTVEKDDGDAAAKIDFQVSGRLRHLKQTKRMDCWAVVATILYSFKYNTESHIEDVLALAGDAYLTAYRDDTGLASAAKADLLTALGLVAAPSNDLDVTRLEQLLRERGPLWVTADEDPTARFSVHGRVVIGLRGDGTLTGTVAFYLDTTPGTPASPRSETVAELREKLTQLAAGDAASGSFRPQIVHF